MKLQIRDGQESRLVEVKASSTIIGRSAKCDLCLTSDVVSSRHAIIKLSNGVGEVSDLGSANGVFVDGKPVAGAQTIGVGSKIQIGRAGPELVVIDGLKSAVPTKSNPKSNKLLLWASAAFLVVVVFTCLLTGLASGLYFYFSGSPTVTHVSDVDKLAQGIGFVIVGMEGDAKDGQKIVIPFNTGTGFTVTSDGYLFTNQHVIERVDSIRKTGSFEFGKKLRDFEEFAAAKELSNAREKIWVVLDGKSHDADLVHVSDKYDFSILKIHGNSFPVFKLSQTDEVEQLTTVYGPLGYPGAASEAMNRREALDDEVRRMTRHSDIIDCFKKDELIFSATEGTVSRTVPKENPNCIWAQHDALINPGNSGGPLVTKNGVVVGLNTLGSFKADTYFALTIRQLKEEIEQHVDDVIWASAR